MNIKTSKLDDTEHDQNMNDEYDGEDSVDPIEAEHSVKVNSTKQIASVIYFLLVFLSLKFIQNFSFIF